MQLGQILKIPLISTALLICLSHSTVPAERHTFTFHKELRTGANPSLRVRNTFGEIRIESHPDNKIIIDALKVVEADDSGKAKRIAEEIEVIVRNYDSRTEIKTRHPSRKSKGLLRRLSSLDGNRSVYVDYHILVPEEIELHIHSASGDVIISDISGGAEVHATSGDVSVRKIKGNLSLETTSGDVEISCTSGKTSVEDVTGSVEIDKSSGDVYLEWIKGNIQTSSSSGDLIIDQIEGGLDLESSSGDIEVKTKILPQCEYYVKTSSGSVDFSLPENSDARLILKTSSGDIEFREYKR